MTADDVPPPSLEVIMVGRLDLDAAEEIANETVVVLRASPLAAREAGMLLYKLVTLSDATELPPQPKEAMSGPQANAVAMAELMQAKQRAADLECERAALLRDAAAVALETAKLKHYAAVDAAAEPVGKTAAVAAAAGKGQCKEREQISRWLDAAGFRGLAKFIGNADHWVYPAEDADAHPEFAALKAKSRTWEEEREKIDGWLISLGHLALSKGVRQGRHWVFDSGEVSVSCLAEFGIGAIRDEAVREDRNVRAAHAQLDAPVQDGSHRKP